jgi:NAD-dependent dihydropyrimidine dehydrogenase PreA subunit
MDLMLLFVRQRLFIGLSPVELRKLTQAPLTKQRRVCMAYVIAEPCINTKDTACVDVCPVDCIHPRKDEPTHQAETMLYINPVECIDCGACVPVCPVTAIFALEDLPEKWTQFTAMNADWYAKK